MPQALTEILAETGVAGVALTIFGWLFLKLMKAHREERDEFRKDIKEDRKETVAVLRELSNVIRDSRCLREERFHNKT